MCFRIHHAASTPVTRAQGRGCGGIDSACVNSSPRTDLYRSVGAPARGKARSHCGRTRPNPRQKSRRSGTARPSTACERAATRSAERSLAESRSIATLRSTHRCRVRPVVVTKREQRAGVASPLVLRSRLARVKRRDIAQTNERVTVELEGHRHELALSIEQPNMYSPCPDEVRHAITSPFSE